MSLKKYFKKNFNFFHHLASGYTSIAINILIFGFLTPYMLKKLGNEQYGIWQLVTNISMYFSMSALGLGSAFYAEFTKYRNDYEKTQKLINTVFFAYLAVAVCSLLVFLVLLVRFDRVFIISPEVVQDARQTFIFSYLTFLLTFIFGFLDVVLFLHNKITTRNLSDIIKITLNGLGSFVLIALGYNIVSIAVLYFVVTAGQMTFNFIMAKKLQPFSLSYRYFDFPYLRNLYKSGFYFFIYTTGVMIIFNTDNILISHFMGAQYVSLYSVIFRFVTISEKFIFVVASVKFPKASSLISQGNYKAVSDIYIKSWLATLGCSVLVALFLSIFGLDVLRIWLGNRQTYDVVLIWIFSMFIVIHSLSNVTGYYLGMLDIIKFQSLITLAEVFLNLILSVVLYKFLGLRGIALGTLASHVIVGSWLPGIHLLRYLKTKIAQP